MIGGGTYSFPKEFAGRFPDAFLDVAEIDPGFMKLARRFFEWQYPENVNIIHEDGGTFLRRAGGKEYEVIYMDAFNSKVLIPFHLTTLEAARLAYDALDGRE